MGGIEQRRVQLGRNCCQPVGGEKENETAQKRGTKNRLAKKPRNNESAICGISLIKEKGLRDRRRRLMLRGEPAKPFWSQRKTCKGKGKKKRGASKKGEKCPKSACQKKKKARPWSEQATKRGGREKLFLGVTPQKGVTEGTNTKKKKGPYYDNLVSKRKEHYEDIRGENLTRQEGEERNDLVVRKILFVYASKEGGTVRENS